ncbi:LysR family transcriptional regulator [Azorhizobium oxalatiphilum]|uniref:LysR family transcriptional regulator n=1 Tax=Azorhizobium oxalatiphilum TaxID=980631 RepID=A0A917FF39_9HYPH|nr:LysR substrate-binding domain-containing protein [Azorhizobium oxalatiphilum]GGF71914.1 LysR family transcriptional regulator [Azorhizobium oxalatiphilum]
MSFDVRELAVLKAVIEKGSVTGAASVLNVSQPAVSRTLQQIEQRLGMPLFRRERQRLYPTHEAEILYRDVVQAVASMEEVARRARDLKEGRSGALRIATIAAFAHSILPRAVARLRARKPGLEFAIDVLTARDVAQRVATFRSDIGLLIDTANIAGISVEELCTFPFGCILPVAHPLAGRASLTIPQIASEPLICLSRTLPLGVLAHRLFEKHDLALRPTAEVSQSSVATALIASGAGIGLLDKSSMLAAMSEPLVFVPLAPAETIVGRLVLPVTGLRTAAAQAFRDELRVLVGEIAAADASFRSSAC